MKARLNTSRITPKKANLVAGMIRGKDANEALEILKYTPKKAAKIIFKLLHSAISNAVNNFDQSEETLFIKEVIVNKGPSLKRSVPISRGRVHPIIKRTAHISISIGIKNEDENVKKELKKK